MKLILCLTFIFCVFQAQAGGVDSGGGHVIYKSATKSSQLLDFYVFDPNISEPQSKHCLNLSLSSNSSHQYLSYDYFDPFELCHGHFKKLWQATKQRWQAQIPFLLSLIEHTYQGMIFRFRLQQYNRAVREWFWWPETLAFTPIQLAALYYSTEGTVINAPSWNRLGTSSKFGLIIHETLKQFELRYRYYFNPKQLQGLVYALVFKQADELNLLEQDRLPEYFLQLEQAYREQAEQSFIIQATRQSFSGPYDRLGLQARKNDKLIIDVLEGELSIQQLPANLPWYQVQANLQANQQLLQAQLKAGVLLAPEALWPAQ